MVRIGCSGWSYQHWKGRFYPGRAPESGWLGLYAETFDTVEVNATFYRLPLRSTVAGWAARTPRTFLFAVKASRYLTHVKRLRDLPAGLARLEERIAPLREADKLGPVLWQLPASFRRDDVRLAETLARLPDGRHAFEFRHPSWFSDEVLELLRFHHVALVIAHHPERPWQPHELTADWTFLRFHYGARGRRGNYSEAELREWAPQVRELARDAEVFAYFNNDWEGFAVANARRLRELVRLT
jgi:uncharacterized protein YecE (DUF72 family)